jgi:hypothetical protein
MSKMGIDVNQLRQLLCIARINGTTDAWINLAMDWAEEANKEACRLTDELAEYKRTDERIDEDAAIMKALTLPSAQISGATPLQEKVVCASCGNAGYIYSNTSTPMLNGYPCPDCNTWYKGNR